MSALPQYLSIHGIGFAEMSMLLCPSGSCDQGNVIEKLADRGSEKKKNVPFPKSKGTWNCSVLNLVIESVMSNVDLNDNAVAPLTI